MADYNYYNSSSGAFQTASGLWVYGNSPIEKQRTYTYTFNTQKEMTAGATWTIALSNYSITGDTSYNLMNKIITASFSTTARATSHRNLTYTITFTDSSGNTFSKASSNLNLSSDNGYKRTCTISFSDIPVSFFQNTNTTISIKVTHTTDGESTTASYWASGDTIVLNLNYILSTEAPTWNNVVQVWKYGDLSGAKQRTYTKAKAGTTLGATTSFPLSDLTMGGEVEYSDIISEITGVSIFVPFKATSHRSGAAYNIGILYNNTQYYVSKTFTLSSSQSPDYYYGATVSLTNLPPIEAFKPGSGAAVMVYKTNTSVGTITLYSSSQLKVTVDFNVNGKTWIK